MQVLLKLNLNVHVIVLLVIQTLLVVNQSQLNK